MNQKNIQYYCFCIILHYILIEYLIAHAWFAISMKKRWLILYCDCWYAQTHMYMRLLFKAGATINADKITTLGLNFFFFFLYRHKKWTELKPKSLYAHIGNYKVKFDVVYLKMLTHAARAQYVHMLPRPKCAARIEVNQVKYEII